MTAQELNNVQEKLIRTERIAAMGNLVNGIAHEIRNPITVIGGFARRIKDKTRFKFESHLIPFPTPEIADNVDAAIMITSPIIMPAFEGEPS